MDTPSASTVSPPRVLSLKEIRDRTFALQASQRMLDLVRRFPVTGWAIYAQGDRLALSPSSTKNLYDTILQLAEDDYNSHLQWFDENNIDPEGV